MLCRSIEHWKYRDDLLFQKGEYFHNPITHRRRRIENWKEGRSLARKGKIDHNLISKEERRVRSARNVVISCVAYTKKMKAVYLANPSPIGKGKFRTLKCQ
jgi:hypothetical protein